MTPLAPVVMAVEPQRGQYIFDLSNETGSGYSEELKVLGMDFDEVILTDNVAPAISLIPVNCLIFLLRYNPNVESSSIVGFG